LSSGSNTTPEGQGGSAEQREVVLSVRDLVVRFDRPGGGKITILNGVTFDAYAGETLVVMGGSGSGKSTLLNCLIGELVPSAGQIVYRLPELGEVDLMTASQDVVNEVRKKFGILFQSGALFSSMTVAENVALPLIEHSVVDQNVIDIVVAMKLQQVHMLEHRDKYPAQLSGGQKKRVGLARATALDPVILFYDEPSAGLDPVTSCAVDELMIDLSQKLKVTSLVVTHEMDSAFRIADRMVMLDKGRILRAASRQEFERLRDTDPEQLESDQEKLIRQFLRGDAQGPISEHAALAEFERVVLGGAGARSKR
jgi:phospholipid/cholesterol/gamma-HCH transport system ATP-binding protein